MLREIEDGDEFLGLLGTIISLGKGVAFEELAGIKFESEFKEEKCPI